MFTKWEIGNSSDLLNRIANEVKRHYESLRCLCENSTTDSDRIAAEKLIWNYISIPLVVDMISMSPDILNEKYPHINAKTCLSCGDSVDEWIESNCLYKDNNCIDHNHRIILCKKCAKKLKDEIASLIDNHDKNEQNDIKIRKLGVKAVHPYAYRWKGLNNKGEITGVFNCQPDIDSDLRVCYQITYPDGEVDYIPVSGFTDGTYEFISKGE